MSPSRSSLALRHLRKRIAGVALVALGAIAVFTACTPAIGDKCALSTDCSTNGDRLCDTSQPDGYCTEFNCSKNSCPDEAVCVFFDSKVQGCTYDDRNGNYGSRVARAFCSAMCTKDSDCRSGYMCSDPKLPPYNGVVVDDDQTKRTCLVIPASFDPDAGQSLATPDINTGLCSRVGPVVAPIDASAASLYDGSPVTDASRSADAADASDAADAADADGG